VTVDALAGAVAIASGEFAACAIRTDGTVRCVGSLDISTGLGPVPDVEDAISISVGPSSACAVIADGTIRCWGDGNHGQLGDGRLAFLDDSPPARSGVRVVAPEPPTEAPAR
jgi:alpha-tubulin suppressor-like RCC1 family protein